VVSRRNSVSMVTKGWAAMRRHAAASSDVVVIGCIEKVIAESRVLVALCKRPKGADADLLSRATIDLEAMEIGAELRRDAVSRRVPAPSG
jgi:hypothetical protein